MLLDNLISSTDPREIWLTTIAITILILAWLTCNILKHFSVTSTTMHRELVQRIKTWAIIIPVAIIPILMGQAGLAAALFVLGISCFREFSRATGIRCDSTIGGPVLIGTLVGSTAILLQSYLLLLLSAPLVAMLSAATALLRDQPKGYLKRLAIANIGFMICGVWTGHLGFLGTGESRGTILIWFLLVVALNDVFAFTAGKLFGRTPLSPTTSPNKTRGGFVGSMILTTTFATVTGIFLFKGETLGSLVVLLGIGLLVSIAGTTGDLILSSIKRDLEVKDLSDTLPGHGGLLDRCDSLIFAAPVTALLLALSEFIHTTPISPLTTYLP